MGKSKSINERMERFHIRIWNASSDEIISARLEPFGYTTEKMEALKTLYNETQELIKHQKDEKQGYKFAGDTFSDTLEKSKKDFYELRDRLRFFYTSDKPMAQTLGLYLDNFGRYADYVAGAKLFYTRLLASSEALEKLVPFGYTTESVTALSDQVNELDHLKETREKESGDAQYATKERNAKLDELEEACNELTRLAKLLFRGDEAQYLEKLGIVVRS